MEELPYERNQKIRIGTSASTASSTPCNERVVINEFNGGVVSVAKEVVLVAQEVVPVAQESLLLDPNLIDNTNQDPPNNEKENENEEIAQTKNYYGNDQSNIPKIIYQNRLKRTNKLICREKELSIIQDIYNNQTNYQSQVIVIRGESGIGKTALAQSFRLNYNNNNNNVDIDNKRNTCYFLEGSFDQLQTNAVFISAFKDLAWKLSDMDKKCIKLNVEKELELSEYQSLADTIPELQCILPEIITPKHGADSLSLFSELDKINRFRNAVDKLLRILVTSLPHTKLILFLDDIQWAGRTDLDFIVTLINNASYPRMLFVITCRDNDENDININLLLKRISNIHLIHLEKLNEEQVNQMVSQLLSVSVEYSKSLAKIIWEQTKGNIFFTLEYLRVLQTEGLIQRNNEGWHWDIQDIQIEYVSLTEMIYFQTESMSTQAQECLRTLSCFGMQIDNVILTRLGYGSDIPCFSEIIQEGWIKLDESCMTWSFAHCRIQEITYQSIPEHDKTRLHYRLGKKLWQKLDMQQLLSFIFVVVGQLVLAPDLIKDPKERTAVAKLCLSAGEQAAKISSFYTARTYFIHGIDLLDSTAWEDEYDLCLSLYGGAAECSYSSGCADTVHDFAYEIMKHATSFEDTIRVRMIDLTATGSSGHMKKALITGLELLSQLGENFPNRPSKFHFFFEMRRLRKQLSGLSDDDILGMPIMTDPTKLAAIQTLSVTFLYAYELNNDWLNILGFRIILVSLEHGICGLTCLGFNLYARTLCYMGFVDEGFRYGQLGVALYEKFVNRFFLPRFYGYYYGEVHLWKRPAQECVEPLLYAHRVALGTGDIEWSMVSYKITLIEEVASSETEQALNEMTKRIYKMQQESFLMLIKPLRQFFHNLMGLAGENPAKLIGQLVKDGDIDKIKSISGLLYGFSSYPNLMVRYFFGDYSDDSLEVAKLSREFSSYTWFIWSSIILLADGLLCIARARESRRQGLSAAKKHSKILARRAVNNPSNFLGKHLILDAELSSLGWWNGKSVFHKYLLAISVTNDNGSLMEYGLSNELAAKFLIRQNAKDEAKRYIRKAISTYIEWGATAKANHFRREMEVHGFKDL